MKWLLVLVVVLGGLMWLKRQRSSSRPPGPSAPPRTSAPETAACPSLMVACAHCGTHVPAGDAVEGPDDGRHYCSGAHAALHAK
jgi:uncharacterized protein